MSGEDVSQLILELPYARRRDAEFPGEIHLLASAGGLAEKREHPPDLTVRAGAVEDLAVINVATGVLERPVGLRVSQDIR